MNFKDVKSAFNQMGDVLDKTVTSGSTLVATGVSVATDTVKGVGDTFTGLIDLVRDEVTTTVLEDKAENAVQKYKIIAKAIKDISDVNKEMGIDADPKEILKDLMQNPDPYKK